MIPGGFVNHFQSRLFNFIHRVQIFFNNYIHLVINMKKGCIYPQSTDVKLKVA